MRTEAKWNETFRENAIRTFFTPRITHDLMLYTDEPALEPGSYFIFGEIATGKTILASKLMLKEIKNAYLEQRMIKPVFVSFPKLLMELRSTYDPKHNVSESVIMNQYLECDFLVIDDFMAAKPTDWVIDIMYHLINHRYEYMKTTVITSNKDLPELEKLLSDQRITSRIDRMCQIIEKEKI